MLNNRSLAIADSTAYILQSMARKLLKLSLRLRPKYIVKLSQFTVNLDKNNLPTIHCMIENKKISMSLSQFFSAGHHTLLNRDDALLLLCQLSHSYSTPLQYSIKPTRLKHCYNIFLDNCLYLENIPALKLLEYREVITHLSDADYKLLSSSIVINNKRQTQPILSIVAEGITPLKPVAHSDSKSNQIKSRIVTYENHSN